MYETRWYNHSCKNSDDLENIVYHYFRQLWLVLRVKLMEINSNLFSRVMKIHGSFLLLTSHGMSAKTKKNGFGGFSKPSIIGALMVGHGFLTKNSPNPKGFFCWKWGNWKKKLLEVKKKGQKKIVFFSKSCNLLGKAIVDPDFFEGFPTSHGGHHWQSVPLQKSGNWIILCKDSIFGGIMAIQPTPPTYPPPEIRG